MEGFDDEELFLRWFMATHATSILLAAVSRFAEWSAMQVFALRGFQKQPNLVFSTKDIALRTHCSMPWASKILGRLAREGLVVKIGNYRQWHSWRITKQGLERLGADAGELAVFSRDVFEGLDCAKRRMLFDALGTVYENVTQRRQLYEDGWARSA